MSCYPPETMRQLDAQAARLDRFESQREMAHRYLSGLITESVKAGIDLKPGRPGSRFATMYPVSNYLGECSTESQALLFKACGEALNGIDCRASLQAFVENVAKEYADDFADEMADGEQE